MNGLTPLTHYEYQKRIAHVWLDNEYYAEEDNNSASSSRSVSSDGTRSSSPSRRSRVSDSSLHPLNGTLKCRMNTALPHWPSPAEGNSFSSQYCQLHLWACDTRKYANCILCRDCNVNLCTQCFTEFHTTWDLVAEKDALKEKYEADSDENNNM